MYYHPDAVANILSQSAEKDNGATITYDDDRDEYTMSFADDDTYIPLTHIHKSRRIILCRYYQYG